MLVRCVTCGKTVPLSEVPGIVTISICQSDKCDFKPTFIYAGSRGRVEYWRQP